MNILFVCTANICRSAMSAAILKKIISEKGLQQVFRVDSAGTEALYESPPEETTIAVCKNHGVDISMHRGQQLTNVMVRNASIILCMAESHRRIIRGIFPQWERKILLLKEFGQAETPHQISVEDPTGRTKRKYEKCFTELETEINRIFPILQELAQQEKLHTGRQRPS
jgi:Protein-tyrosine-phosphatase